MENIVGGPLIDVEEQDRQEAQPPSVPVRRWTPRKKEVPRERTEPAAAAEVSEPLAESAQEAARVPRKWTEPVEPEARASAVTLKEGPQADAPFEPDWGGEGPTEEPQQEEGEGEPTIGSETEAEEQEEGPYVKG